MNIGLIAEGIEQREELVKLTRMGVQYAQGYLLARPGTLPVSIDPEMISHIQLHRRASSSAEVWMIGDLAAPVKTFDVKTPVSEVVSYFKRQSDEPAAVLVSGEAPVGLIMREQLFRQMSGQYSFSLYSHRTIDNLMDAQPLMVESSMPVEQVSQLATSRDKPNLYDLVIITREGRMAGAASIHSILETITNIRMENARVANPLTGLPGNLQINRELSKRLLDNKDFSIIYIDLDFFKWFNDRYGFQKGDQLIQYTADILQQSIAVCGSPHDFVGHVGGDDFIVLTSAEDAAKMCGEMIRRFDQGVRLFYEGEDWRSVEDRNGNPIDNDGVTLSLSLLRCAADSGVTQEQISQVSAKLKKKAKAHRGSVYVSYRVGEPGL
jgi:GGDEF domain-containing protein